MEHIDHVPYTTRCLFYLGCKIDAGHGNNLKIKSIFVKKICLIPVRAELHNFKKKTNQKHNRGLKADLWLAKSSSHSAQGPGLFPSSLPASLFCAHLEAVLDEGLRIEEPMKQHLPRRHRHLSTQKGELRRSRSQSPGPTAAAILCQAPAGATTPPAQPPHTPFPPSHNGGAGPCSLPPRESRGAHTYLRQAEKDAGRLNELAPQDAQVGLALQVQAVLHRRSGREALLGDERVVDGERHLRVEPVTDKDARGGGNWRGGSCCSGGRGARVCGGGGHDGEARPYPEPATHRLTRPGAVTQRTMTPARGTTGKKVRRPRPTAALARAAPSLPPSEPAGTAAASLLRLLAAGRRERGPGSPWVGGTGPGKESRACRSLASEKDMRPRMGLYALRGVEASVPGMTALGLEWAAGVVYSLCVKQHFPLWKGFNSVK